MSTPEALWDEAIGHLKKLMEKGCETSSEMDWSPECFYCYGDGLENHDSDCPWVAAKDFLKRVGENPASVPNP